MLELIRRCQYCDREMMNVSAQSHTENPFCNKCLSERLAAAKQRSGATGLRLIGNYLKPILTLQKGP